MCENLGPKPNLLAVLDATGSVALRVDDALLCSVDSAHGKLPVVTYPAGQVDCVLAPPEAVEWTLRGDAIAAGATVVFSGTGAVAVPTLGAYGARVLEGRSPDGRLVRLRVQPRHV